MKNKKTVLWFALIVTAIIPACAQQYDTRLNGTWEDEDIITKFNSGFLEYSDKDGTPFAQGAYTTSNGKLTITITHCFGIKLGLDSKWYSKDEFGKNFDPNWFSTDLVEYTVDSNKLIITNDDGDKFISTLVSRDGKFTRATTSNR
jgi:hypothetical protein